MTPIKSGTATKLGLRKPLPPLEVEVSVDMRALNEAFRGMREFMARNDAQVRAAFETLRENLRSVL